MTAYLSANCGVAQPSHFSEKESNPEGSAYVCLCVFNLTAKPSLNSDGSPHIQDVFVAPYNDSFFCGFDSISGKVIKTVSSLFYFVFKKKES